MSKMTVYMNLEMSLTLIRTLISSTQLISLNFLLFLSYRQKLHQLAKKETINRSYEGRLVICVVSFVEVGGLVIIVVYVFTGLELQMKRMKLYIYEESR